MLYAIEWSTLTVGADTTAHDGGTMLERMYNQNDDQTHWFDTGTGESLCGSRGHPEHDWVGALADDESACDACEEAFDRLRTPLLRWADDAEALTPDWEVESLVPFVSGDHTWEAWTPLTSHYTRAEAEVEVAAIIAESPNSWPLRIVPTASLQRRRAKSHIA